MNIFSIVLLLEDNMYVKIVLDHVVLQHSIEKLRTSTRPRSHPVFIALCQNNTCFRLCDAPAHPVRAICRLLRNLIIIFQIVAIHLCSTLIIVRLYKV